MELDLLAERGAHAEWTYTGSLERPLDVEVSARYARDVGTGTNLTSFLFIKALQEFSSSFRPAVSEHRL